MTNNTRVYSKIKRYDPYAEILFQIQQQLRQILYNTSYQSMNVVLNILSYFIKTSMYKRKKSTLLQELY